MQPLFFSHQLEFRKWLEENSETAGELLVGFYKVGSGKPSMTWSESVDQALCFGWIDGVRKSFDSESYTIRFTPRKPTSIWSAINIKKVEELTAKGLMLSAGIIAFEKRQEHRSRIYSYEKAPVDFSQEYQAIFESNTIAWEFFLVQAPSYKKLVTHHVMCAKQELTRVKRLNELIQASEQGKRIR